MAPRPGLWQRLLALLGRADVRRRLASLPVGRSIARHHARRLFDLSAGFTYSQILAAFVELDLPDLLGAGGRLAAADLAARTAIPQDAMARLLDGAAALGLVRPGRDGYRLTTLGAALRDNPALTAMIKHHRLLYLDLADPVALLREGRGDRLAAFWPYAGPALARDLAPDQVAGYTELMTASATLVVEQVLDSYPVGSHRHLLDVGGGEGAFALAASRASPELQVTVFDLPAVAERARLRLEEAERQARSGQDPAAARSPRVAVVAGDFRADPLPPGADLVTLVRVLHDHDDQTVVALLRKVRAAIPPGGRVLIAEPFAATAGARTVGDAYFGMYLLAMGRGRCRSVARYRELLSEAGFSRVRRWPTAVPLQAGVLTAS